MRSDQALGVLLFSPSDGTALACDGSHVRTLQHYTAIPFHCAWWTDRDFDEIATMFRSRGQGRFRGSDYLRPKMPVILRDLGCWAGEGEDRERAARAAFHVYEGVLTRLREVVDFEQPPAPTLALGLRQYMVDDGVSERLPAATRRALQGASQSFTLTAPRDVMHGGVRRGRSRRGASRGQLIPLRVHRQDHALRITQPPVPTPGASWRSEELPSDRDKALVKVETLAAEGPVLARIMLHAMGDPLVGRILNYGNGASALRRTTNEGRKVREPNTRDWICSTELLQLRTLDPNCEVEVLELLRCDWEEVADNPARALLEAHLERCGRRGQLSYIDGLVAENLWVAIARGARGGGDSASMWVQALDRAHTSLHAMRVAMLIEAQGWEDWQVSSFGFGQVWLRYTGAPEGSPLNELACEQLARMAEVSETIPPLLPPDPGPARRAIAGRLVAEKAAEGREARTMAAVALMGQPEALIKTGDVPAALFGAGRQEQRACA